MKRSLLLSIAILAGLNGCLDDPGPTSPVSGPIRSYFILYNFLTEPYDIRWEVDNNLVEAEHSFGDAILGFTSLDSTQQDVPVTVMSSDGTKLIEQALQPMKQDQYYIMAIMGSESAPRLVCDTMDLMPPPVGKIRLRFMQTMPGLEPLDLYIGGSSLDHQVFAGMKYGEFSDYTECTQEEIWESMQVTPQGISPEDSTLFSFSQNNIFYSRRIYLGIVRFSKSDTASAPQLLFYDHPLLL